jgi:ketosteroid isomerase-like protein
MSGDPIAVAVKLFEDINERDFASVVDAYAEGVTLVMHALGDADQNTFTGKTAVVDWFSDWFRQFRSDYRFSVDDVQRGAGDAVFLVATHHGRGRASGAPIEQQIAYVFTVRESRVCAMEVWSDREQALRAAGLSA